MHTAADFRQERHELDTILGSGILSRAPNLAHLLTYVCTKYFEGTAEQIKEYNIAVDALGRPADFDQKRDSIVRVEAHRLRKRLREYYEADGADHVIRIDIPPGQYAPRFVTAGTPLPSLSVDTLVAQGELVPESPAPASMESESPGTSLIPGPTELVIPPVTRGAGHAIGGRAMAAALLLVVGAVAIAVWRRPEGRAAVVAPAPAAIAAPVANLVANPREVRILAGRQNGDYTDRLGRIWQSDRYFQGGSVFESHDHPIFGTREPRIYQSRREGAFSYDIPLPAGVYELRLHFAETLFGENNIAGGGESSRVFNVSINGKEALNGFDVIADAGPSTADVRAFKDISPAPDGKLHISFEPSGNSPLLCAIEIAPGTPGRLRPIRMISLDRVYVDKQGRVWEPDGYVRGGQLIARTTPVEGGADPELFRGERFGNLRYVIPVPSGRYGVTFYFAEAWFGPNAPGRGGVGSRVFDILCNGKALRLAFDVFKEARGGERGVTWSVHGLEPDAQGKLNIALTPIRNYACVNAVEVLDESK
jgi:Malectin domain